MDIIKSFIDQYKGKIDFYEMAARIAAQNLELLLDEAGIRAIVTYRAKSAKSLDRKLRMRNTRRDRKYETAQDIFDDIADLAGVRLALYFPGDKRGADSLILNNFALIEPVKIFPESSKTTPKGKRFSGYWANHYRVHLKEELLSSNQKKYADTKIEIQVASVLMHAWSEVEHDLIYKPLSGRLTDEELLILDELNGLVLSGELALERLQKAGDARIQSSKDKFKSQFDLASYLSTRFHRKGKPEISVLQMGNIELLYKLVRQLELDDPQTLAPYLRSVHVHAENAKNMETIDQQIIDHIITGNKERYRTYRSLIASDETADTAREQAMGFFLRHWIALEQELNQQTAVKNPRARSSFTLNNLQKLGFSKSLINQILSLRRSRNDAVHGTELPAAEHLTSLGEKAQELLSRIRQQSQPDVPASPAADKKQISAH